MRIFSALKGNVKEQYDMFNKYYSDANTLIINGDVTEFGHAEQWEGGVNCQQAKNSILLRSW